MYTSEERRAKEGSGMDVPEVVPAAEHEEER
jgi:hypothetical protein